MAIKACKECKEPVSTRAKKCPKCGVPNPTVSWTIGCISAILSVTILVAICGGGLYAIGIGAQSASSAVSKAVEESQRAEEEKQATKSQINETVHVGYMSYEVREVWRQTTQESVTNERLVQGTGPYVFIRVAVRNNDKKARQIPPFKLIDANGAEYQQSSEAWLVDGSFGILESLNPSVSKEGIVVFVAPFGRGYDVLLDGGFWSSDSALVSIEEVVP